ncbi:MAG: hypothetical protein IMZ71_02730 [Chloroflexi bacterium]|nr:hypothetical protein [Chloroflexota bacterium]
MAYMNDLLYDLLLAGFSGIATRLDICSQEPATYTEATSTYTLGNKTGITYQAPADRSGGGREIAVDAISGGSVTGTALATHWAITKPTATTALYSAKTLSASQNVTSGNTFTLASFKIGVPDAV